TAVQLMAGNTLGYTKPLLHAWPGRRLVAPHLPLAAVSEVWGTALANWASKIVMVSRTVEESFRKSGIEQICMAFDSRAPPASLLVISRPRSQASISEARRSSSGPVKLPLRSGKEINLNFLLTYHPPFAPMYSGCTTSDREDGVKSRIL